MSDIDPRGLWGPLGDQLHKPVLALWIKGGGGVVEHNNVGVSEENASESRSLLFAA